MFLVSCCPFFLNTAKYPFFFQIPAKYVFSFLHLALHAFFSAFTAAFLFHVYRFPFSILLYYVLFLLFSGFMSINSCLSCFLICFCYCLLSCLPILFVYNYIFSSPCASYSITFSCQSILSFSTRTCSPSRILKMNDSICKYHHYFLRGGRINAQYLFHLHMVISGT